MDRQTDRLRCIVVHCGALQKHRRTLLYHCGALRTIMVHCSELQKRCGRLADHCGALGCMQCMYHTLRWSASHTKPPCNNSGTLRKLYRKLTDQLERLWTIVMPCSALQYIVVQVAHAVVECITHSRKRQIPSVVDMGLSHSILPHRGGMTGQSAPAVLACWSL